MSKPEMNDNDMIGIMLMIVLFCASVLGVVGTAIYYMFN